MKFYEMTVCFPKPSLTWKSMMDFQNLSVSAAIYMVYVYSKLAWVLWSSFFGSLLHFYKNVGGPFTVVCIIGCLMAFMSLQRKQVALKINLFVMAAFWGGASLEYLIRPLMDVDEVLILTVLGGTAVAISTFRDTAIWSRNRVYIYRNGVIYAFMTVGLWLIVAPHWFAETHIVTRYFFAPYIGLLFLFWYVFLYTQELVKQIDRDAAEIDFTRHIVIFFTGIPSTSFWFWSITVQKFHQLRRPLTKRAKRRA